jgi:hypothetical protein
VTLVSPPSGAVFAVGTPVSFVGAFTDNAGDTHTAKWFLDSQAVAGVVNEAMGSVTLSRAFTVPGVYAVTLSVTDQCGGVGTASDIGGMTAMVVIYDPNGGFVTGGGWVNSPAGAYRPDTTAAGKANFGFVSKYKKGATVPDGETEFQFKAGNLNFHSSSYDWLVVSGSRAQFKGLGTVNGTGDYGFLLSAIDGDLPGGGKTDKFRMKVWERATGVIVYDNQYGNPDSSAATTVLGGGSIMITTASPSGKAALAMAPGLDGESARTFALAQAFPNPFRSTTSLRFSVPEPSRVTLAVYDAAGREVARPWDGDTEPGAHTVAWPSGSSHDLHSGVYFVRLTAVSSSGIRFDQKQTVVLVR